MSNSAAVSQAISTASLYVGDLLPEVTENDIHGTFGDVGTIQSIRLCRDAATGRSLGYAYVNFSIPTDAERAKDIKNGVPIKGKPCRVCWSVRDSAVRQNNKSNVFVKNLPADVDVRRLSDLFAGFGNIISSKVSTEDSGKSRGYGFVHFEDEAVANELVERAAKEGGLKVGNITVQVERFKSADQRRSTDDTFTNVYIKNIPTTWTDAELADLFKPYGETTSVSVPRDEEGNGKGFGFANFATHAQAVEAIKNVHGRVLTEGSPALHACRALIKTDRERQKANLRERLRQEYQQKSAGCNLYVNNLPQTMTEADFLELFGKFGQITSSKMQFVDGNFVGVAFICYSNRDEAAKAITEMNRAVLAQKPLLVTHHQPRETRAQMFRAMRVGTNNGYPRMMPHFMQQQDPMRRVPRGPYGNRRGPYNGVRKPRPQQRPLNQKSLASMPAAALRQTLGEQLYPLVQAALGAEHDKAPKITGMLLEMEPSEVLATLENPQELEAKIHEALEVLANAGVNVAAPQ